MRRGALVGIALLLAAGCAKGSWQRPGATEAELRRDSSECDEHAWVWENVPRFERQRTKWILERNFSYPHYRACMEPRGYRWVREGG
ncbi:MAG: hypothetical protein HYV62_13700 [Candidatus Rokubacteria bacterium]|nr:hypothetical protein [Candidatus Rokubacteria bacterium]